MDLVNERNLELEELLRVGSSVQIPRQELGDGRCERNERVRGECNIVDEFDLRGRFAESFSDLRIRPLVGDDGPVVLERLPNCVS